MKKKKKKTNCKTVISSQATWLQDIKNEQNAWRNRVVYCKICTTKEQETRQVNERNNQQQNSVVRETAFYTIHDTPNGALHIAYAEDLKTQKCQKCTAEDIAQFRQVCADVYRTVGFKPNE